MGISASEDEQKQGPLPPAGQTLGICVAVVDLGTQLVQFKPNTEAKPTKQIHLTFELPGHTAVFDEKKGPQTMVLSQKYTNSLYAQGGFRKMLDSWFGKPITTMPLERAKKLPGISCMIQVTHNQGKKHPEITYANIANKGLGIYPRDPKLAPVKPENELIYFDLDEGQFSLETFNKLPKFLKEIIEKSPEYKDRIKGVSTPPATGNAIVDSQGAAFNAPVEEDF